MCALKGLYWYMVHGARIAAISARYGGNAEKINLEVFKSWINGEGREPISWNTLVTVLREIGLRPLADIINSTRTGVNITS